MRWRHRGPEQRPNQKGFDASNNISIVAAASLRRQWSVEGDSVASNAQYSIRLYRERTGVGTGLQTSGVLLNISGGNGSSGFTSAFAGSSSTFPVTDSDSYFLEVSLGGVLTNGFCSATVNVTIP